MGKVDMNVFIKIGIVISIIIISSSIFYYLVIFLPSIEKGKLRQQEIQRLAEKQEKLAEEYKEKFKEQLLDACLSDAYDTYLSGWNSSCRSFGMNHKGDACTLPKHIADSRNRYHKELREECYRRYSR